MVDEKPLTNPIIGRELLIREPSRLGQGIRLVAGFRLNNIGLTRAQILRAFTAGNRGMRLAVRSMINRKYARGNAFIKGQGFGPPLQIKTGRLIAHTKSIFLLKINIKSLTSLEITIQWNPSVKYFVFQMFGTRFIPARPFVVLDRKLLLDMERALESQLRKIAIRRAPVEERRAKRRKVRRPKAKPVSRRELVLAKKDIRRATGDAVAVARAKEIVKEAGRRPTPFKIRKALRRSGLPASEARRLVAQFSAITLASVAVGVLSAKPTDPAAQAIIKSTIGFQVLFGGRR